jgi:hypothetical protein
MPNIEYEDLKISFILEKKLQAKDIKKRFVYIDRFEYKGFMFILDSTLQTPAMTYNMLGFDRNGNCYGIEQHFEDKTLMVTKDITKIKMPKKIALELLLCEIFSMKNEMPAFFMTLIYIYQILFHRNLTVEIVGRI